MNIRNIISLMAISAACFSCGKDKDTIHSRVINSDDQIKIIDSVNGKGSHMYFTSWDASHRSMVFMYQVQNNGNLLYHILSESPPDAMQDFSNSIAASLKVGMEKAGGGDANFSRLALQNMQSLGKRNSSVNMLRDALYRLSEMNFNGYLTPQISDTLVRLAICQTALVGVKEAETEIVNAQLEIARVNLAAIEAKNQLVEKVISLSKSDTAFKRRRDDILYNLTK